MCQDLLIRVQDDDGDNGQDDSWKDDDESSKDPYSPELDDEEE